MMEPKDKTEGQLALRGTSIGRILSRADNLRIFPAAAIRIRQVADSPNTSLVDLEEAVASDPALSAQILKVANSPFYGLRRKVGSLRRALFVIGFRATRNMALALAMLSMKKKTHPLRGKIARHSMRVGIAAQQIARQRGGFDPGEMFVGGMLHDLGKLVLMEMGQEKYLTIDERLHRGSPDLLPAEQALFNVDHAELGAACLEHWNLPDETCEAVRLHHATPGATEELHLSPARAIVWLSDQLEHALEAWHKPTTIAERLAETEAAQALRLDQEFLRELAETLRSVEDPFDLFE
jgi:putative nucleotidyltransferase with HDIG domain